MKLEERVSRILDGDVSPVATFTLGIVPDERNPAVRPQAADVLTRLLNEGRLTSFFDRPTNERDGDCHDSALSLLRDLRVAGADRGWVLVQGVCKRIGLHSWLEFDGWAVDFSNTSLHPALIMPLPFALQMWRPAQVRRFVAADFASKKKLKQFTERMPNKGRGAQR